MAAARSPRRKINPRPPFFDEEERDLIESYEAAFDRGEVAANSPEELAEAKARWKAAVVATQAQRTDIGGMAPRDLAAMRGKLARDAD